MCSKSQHGTNLWRFLTLPAGPTTAPGALDQARQHAATSFDLFMAEAAEFTNRTMKVLTLVNVMLLPAVVVAAILGMNFKIPFFEQPANSYVVLAGMALLTAGIRLVARLRRWV